jgi:hypothetical protein
MQIISSSMGGYLAGRLRTKWANIHTDEVYFRDTAHGFLAWAVALVITAAFLASAATSMMGAAAQLSATASSAGAERELNPNEYFGDALFRSDNARPDSNGATVRGEAGRIFANALRQGQVPPADKSYLAQLVASKTGFSRSDAEKRVSTSRRYRPQNDSAFIVVDICCSLDWRVLRELHRDHRGQTTGSCGDCLAIRRHLGFL